MTKSQKQKNKTNYAMAILLTIVVAIIPLVCKLSLVPIRDAEINTIRTGTAINDIFVYTKSILILCMGFVTGIYLVFDLFSEESMILDIKSKPVILVAIYLVLAIISTLFSKHLSVALLGASERYEGLFIWICYIIFFISALAYSNEKPKAELLMNGFVLSGLLLGIIGVMQFMNIPVFESALVSKLIAGSENAFKIKFDSVYATLYNPNCAGLYFGMISSVFIMLSVFLPIKNKLKYASIVVAVLTLISVTGTSSVGGFLGLGCGLGFSVIVAACYFIFKKKSKSAAILSVVTFIVIIACSIAFFNSDATIARKTKIILNAISSGETLDSSTNFYKDINIDGNKGNIVTANGIYTIEADYQNTKFLHDNVELSPSSTEPANKNGGTHYSFSNNDLTWELYLYDGDGIYNISLVSADSEKNEKFFMFGQNENGLSCLDKFGKPIDINQEIKTFGFKGIERLGSNRGYIWSRSLPLVIKNIVVGAGPDCYEFEFPQHDIKSKLMYLNDPYIIIDKPHNMYLQYAINTGLISLIVLVVLFVLYIVQTINSLFNNDNSITIVAFKLGIMAGVVAYLAAGMTTDSVVAVAPVFWTLLGMGFGVNLIGNTKSKEEREIERIKKKLK